MNISDLILGGSYEFSPHAAAIWAKYTNAVFAGSVSYDIAAGIAPAARMHASALAYLPAGTTTDPTRLKYLLFRANDTTFVMAQEWINAATLKVVTNDIVTVVIAQASITDATRIRSALQAAGFKIASIN